MLETSEERIKLLKAGLSTRAIERLYIKSNNLRIIRVPVLPELIGHGFPVKTKIYISHEPAVRYAAKAPYAANGIPC